MPGGNWISRLLKNRGQVMVRFLEFEVYRRCLNCMTNTQHQKAEDQQGNHYYFCKQCGSHN